MKRGALKALVVRALAGLAYSRMFLLGGLLLLLALAPVVTRMFFLKSYAEVGHEETSGMIRQAAWGWETIMFTVIIQVFAVSLATSCLSSDIKKGTLFAVLARPVSRTKVYLGTWIACALLLLLFEAMRLVPGIIGSMVFEGGLDPRIFFGCTAVIAGELLTFSLFLFLAVLFEPAFAVVIGVCWYALIAFSLTDHSSLGRILADLFAAPFPQPLHQTENLIKALTGETKEWQPVLEILLYRTAWTALFVVSGAWCFRRKDLAPRI